MKTTRSVPILCALLLAAAARTAAGPEEQPRLVLTVEVHEEVSAPDEEGQIKITRRDVQRAEPGDVLVYTLTYTNVGDRPAKDARVDDPIPAGTILLPGSVVGERARVSYSIDGGKTFSTFPAMIDVAGVDGVPVRKEAPADRYTHIRWTALTPLAPGESRTASFKVVVR